MTSEDQDSTPTAAEASVNLTRSIDESFKEHASHHYVDIYLGEILTNWRDGERDIKRSMALMIILALTFELTGRRGLAEFDVGFIKITDANIIRGAIPVVIAYLINSTVVTMSDILFYSRGMRDILSTVHKTFTEKGLQVILWPANSIIHSPSRLFQIISMPDWINNSLGATLILRAIAILGLPVAFEVYAYIILFSSSGLSLLLLLSCIVSAVLILTAAISITSLWYVLLK